MIILAKETDLVNINNYIEMIKDINPNIREIKYNDKKNLLQITYKNDSYFIYTHTMLNAINFIQGFIIGLDTHA